MKNIAIDNFEIFLYKCRAGLWTYKFICNLKRLPYNSSSVGQGFSLAFKSPSYFSPFGKGGI